MRCTSPGARRLVDRVAREARDGLELADDVVDARADAGAEVHHLAAAPVQREHVARDHVVHVQVVAHRAAVAEDAAAAARRASGR